MKIFKETNKNKKSTKNEWQIRILTIAKYTSLTIGGLVGIRLLSIMWQKTILQLFVEGWTDDLMSIYLSIIIMAVTGAVAYWSEGKRFELQAVTYNKDLHEAQQKELWSKRMGRV